MKTTLVTIPENRKLNVKQKKTPRVKNTQHTEFDYIMLNNNSKVKVNNPLCGANKRDENEYVFETEQSVSPSFKKIVTNKEQIFNRMNDIFDGFHLEHTDYIKKHVNSINSKEVIDNIKHCFIRIHQYIENEKKYSGYDISSNIADTMMTNQLNKPKQPRIDTILEIKKKEIEPKQIDPYEIITYKK